MGQTLIEAANNIGGKYAGILGLIGFATGIFGIIYGFYSRNNPKKSKYEISYKTYGLDNSISRFRLRHILTGRKDPYRSYIDIWNSGSETIPASTIRQPLTIGVQGEETIISAIVTQESHPGISKFKVDKDGDLPQVSWDHFDPGMAARIEISSEKPKRTNDLNFFGSAYRTRIKRVNPHNEISTPIDYLVMGSLLGMSLAVISIIFGKLFISASESISNVILIYFLSIPTIILSIALIALFIAAPIIATMTLKNYTTPKSPIEREFGAATIEEMRGDFNNQEDILEARAMLAEDRARDLREQLDREIETLNELERRNRPKPPSTPRTI